MNEALVVTGLAYLVFALAGSIPFLPHAGFADALFESMSGFTTTGLTVVPLEHLPRSLLFFRAFSQWIGGAGIIILSLVVLAGSGLSWTRLYGLEFGEGKLVGSVFNTARLVFRVYSILTVAGIVALMVTGASPFEALLLALAALSTGGFAPSPDGVANVGGPWLPTALVVLMVLGAIGLPLYHLARREGLRVLVRDPQVRLLAILILAGTLWLWLGADLDFGQLTASLFHAASSATTTGFSLSPEANWSQSSKLLTVVLMSIGGATGSTAGGMKLFRLLTALALVRWLVFRYMLPREAHVPLRVGGTVIGRDELAYAFAFMAGYLLVLLLGGLLLTLAGHSALDAVFESASAVGTVGMSVGIANPDAASWVKMLLALEMWIGRLELLPVLVLFYPRTWLGGEASS
jgi:trk system potassium uptake protein TrkH